MTKTRTTERRSYALDALRGIAILLMVLSGNIHTDPPLPGWMFHAQVGPPQFVFTPDIPGITWVDLVFPFFLFAMGMAVPFALSRKLDQGVSRWTVVAQILLRGVLLAGFAIYVQHVKPFALKADPGATEWLVGLLGFALLFPILLRLPASVKSWLRLAVRVAGIVGAMILLALLRFPDGGGFSLNRSDIIIMLLANVAVFGSLIWLVTRETPLVRLGILGVLMALRLTQGVEGSWNHWLWTATPFPWMYKLYYLQYLFIVIPGTIAGDLVYAWTKGQRELESSRSSTPSRAILLGLLMGTAILVNLVGLYTRAVLATAVTDVILCVAAAVLTSNPKTDLERLFKLLVAWGSYWLLLGLFFEAYEGGIKKDHPTMSYYFVTAGLAIFTYVAFSVVADRFKKPGAIRLLSENGQNPMIAYIGAANLVLPILALTSADSLIAPLLQSPWMGFVRGLIITLFVAFATQLFTRYRLFWRT